MITLPTPGLLDYPLFYMLGFAISSAMLARESARRGWDPGKTGALAVWVALGGIAGSRLLLLVPGLWDGDVSGGKTWIGGLLGGWLAGAVAGRLLGLKGAEDAFARIAPVAVILGRLGCLFGGCCHGGPLGEVLGEGWEFLGIRYAQGTDPWMFALDRGWSGPHDATTPALVPAPLVEILLTLPIFAVLPRISEAIPGRRFAAAVVGMLLARLAVEPLRVDSGSLGALTAVQAGILAALPMVLAMALPKRDLLPALPPASPGVLWGAALAGTLLFRDALSPLEFDVMGAMLGGALVPFALGALGRRPLLAPAAVLLAVAADDPAPPADSEPLDDETPPFDDLPPDMVQVGVAASGGRYVETCGGPHRFTTGAVQVRYVRPISHVTDFRFQASAGYQEDRDINTGLLIGRPSALFRADLDYMWVGVGLGLAATQQEAVVNGRVVSPTFQPLPVAWLRLGPKDRIWLESELLPIGEYLGPGTPYFRLGLGFDLRPLDVPLRIRGGVGEAGGYLTPTWFASDEFELGGDFTYASADTWRVGGRLLFRIPRGEP